MARVSSTVPRLEARCPPHRLTFSMMNSRISAARDSSSLRLSPLISLGEEMSLSILPIIT